MHVTEAEERSGTNQDDMNSLKAQSNTIKIAMEGLVLKVDDFKKNKFIVGILDWLVSLRRCVIS